MANSRKQFTRLLKFVSEMKRKKYPNSKSFAEVLRQADITENIDIACDARTVQRDIEMLKKQYDAPIAFDAARNGYYLTNQSWSLQVPMSNDFIAYSLLGSRALSEIVPAPLKLTMRSTMETTLASGKSDFLNEGFFETLIIASGLNVMIKTEIFKAIFDAWRGRSTLNIKYCGKDGEKSSRNFEPQIIAFHHGIWYLKGYSLPDRKLRVMAIHRIETVKILPQTFTLDMALLNETQTNGLFVYPKLEGVRLRCDASIAFYLREHQPVKKFKIEPQQNGDLIITLGPAIEHEVIRWILGESGKIEVLSPIELRSKIAASGKKIMEINS
ncbi:MAG: WYL domain-containing protein [Alphaproteobacteria bacterium]|nr:WYL domain-containing protein [Alphaproteobacteria bacterium]